MRQLFRSNLKLSIMSVPVSDLEGSLTRFLESIRTVCLFYPAPRFPASWPRACMISFTLAFLNGRWIQYVRFTIPIPLSQGFHAQSPDLAKIPVYSVIFWVLRPRKALSPGKILHVHRTRSLYCPCSRVENVQPMRGNNISNPMQQFPRI